MNTDASLDLWERQLRRERAARKSAETLLERKSLELFNANLELRTQNAQLVALNSQLESAHVQLLQAEMLASLGQLAAGMAHEINNPIGFVQCNLDTLEQYLADLLQLLDAHAALEQATPAEHEERLAALRARQRDTDLAFLRQDLRQLFLESHAGIARVGKIVQDLRDFARIDSAPGWQLANLEQGLDATLNVLAGEFPAGIAIVRDYGRTPEIECLPAQLNQVFLNLLRNASQALGAGGQIHLRSGQEGPRVWVEIADNGCGIPLEQQAKVFEPFFTTRPVGQGRGLGLAVAFGIAQRHHGEFELHSQPGQGSRFRLWLPLRQPAEG